jgi:hypothetical protein
MQDTMWITISANPLPDLTSGTALLKWGLTTLVSALVGSFLAGYLKQKGENLATHEDVEKLAKETATLTQATKSVEASISDRVWGRQRQWKLRRNALIAAVQALDKADDELIKVGASYEKAPPSDSAGAASWKQLQWEVRQAWTAAADEFDDKRAIVDLVCSPSVSTAVREARQEIRIAAQGMFKGTIKTYGEVAHAIQLKRKAVLDLARQELGIDPDK